MPPPRTQDISDLQQAMADAADAWLHNPRAAQSREMRVTVSQQLRVRHSGMRDTSRIAAGHSQRLAVPSTVVTPFCLMRLQGEQRHTTWPLPTSRPLVLGRSGKKISSLDIDLWPDPTVSRRHALLWFDGKQWRVDDLRSANGIWLGDREQRVERSLPLLLGTKMHFGLTVLMLVALDEAETQVMEVR